MRSIAMITALIIGLASGCREPAASQDKPTTEPTVAIVETNHEQFQAWIADHAGKVMVVDIWATWCPPCLKEFPGLVKLSQDYDPEQVACVSLCCDFEGLNEFPLVKQRALDFLRDQQASFDNFISTTESDEFFPQLGIASIPVVDVYAADGKLHKRFEISTDGEFSYDDVRRVVDELVGQGRVP